MEHPLEIALRRMREMGKYVGLCGDRDHCPCIGQVSQDVAELVRSLRSVPADKSSFGTRAAASTS